MGLIDNIRKDRVEGGPGYDLVKRLRLRIQDSHFELGDNQAVMDAEDTMIEAADRIEALEAALLAASELAAHADAAHDELELWFESANDLENSGFEIGDTELVMNALSRALAAYRKATE